MYYIEEIAKGYREYCSNEGIDLDENNLNLLKMFHLDKFMCNRYQKHFASGDKEGKEFLNEVLCCIGRQVTEDLKWINRQKLIQKNHKTKEQQIENFKKLLKTVDFSKFGGKRTDKDMEFIMNQLQNPKSSSGEMDLKTARGYKRALLFYQETAFPKCFTEEDKVYLSMLRYKDKNKSYIEALMFECKLLYEKEGTFGSKLKDEFFLGPKIIY